MRISLEQNITFVAMASPAMMILLAKKANEYREEIMKDIEEGTLSKKFKIPKEVREEIGAGLKSNPRRAQQLREFIKKRGGLYPCDYWPNLKVLCCWKGGPMISYLPQVYKYFGDIAIRDVGNCGGTEVQCNMPISDEGSDGVICVDNAFVEFVKEEEISNKNPKTYTLDQIEQGKNYYIIATNIAGLYRYNFEDIIKVRSKYKNLPTIEFVNKSQFFSTITGEKLSEWQLSHAIKKAAEETKLSVSSFVAKPKIDETPFYYIFIKFDQVPTKEKGLFFLKEVDRFLCKLNVEYKKRRETQRLKHPVLKLVKSDPYTIFHKYKVGKLKAYGAQIKMPRFVQFIRDPDFIKKLQVTETIKVHES